MVRRTAHEGALPTTKYSRVIVILGRSTRSSFSFVTCSLGGGGQLDGLVFRAPVAFQQARWMAKFVHCIKVALFVGQALLTGREVNGIRRVAVLVALLWHEAVVARWAGKNDLNFLEALRIYPDRPTGALSSASFGTYHRN